MTGGVASARQTGSRVDDRNWTYPRAVQDDIPDDGGARVVGQDHPRRSGQRTYATRREEKNKDGQLTRTVDAEYVYPPDAKVWKGRGRAGPGCRS